MAAIELYPNHTRFVEEAGQLVDVAGLLLALRPWLVLLAAPIGPLAQVGLHFPHRLTTLVLSPQPTATSGDTSH
jgi:hypothetical protein